MECFRFGLDFPLLNRKAVILSSKVLSLPAHHRRRRFYVAPPPPPSPVRLKVYEAPTFSIELENLFEVLDI